MCGVCMGRVVCRVGEGWWSVVCDRRCLIEAFLVRGSCGVWMKGAGCSGGVCKSGCRERCLVWMKAVGCSGCVCVRDCLER